MKRNWLWLGLALAAVVMAASCGGAKGPDAARGAALYDQRCWNCHEKDTDAMALTPGQGPGLKGFAIRTPHQDMNGAQHEHTGELIRHYVRDGSTNMPPQGTGLSDVDLADLVAYVMTL